jgi:hypothetical protein
MNVTLGKTLYPGLLTFMAIAFADQAGVARSSCDIDTAGDIGATWHALGGAESPLGCPTSPEINEAGMAGRIQSFEFGQISWSPDRGEHPILVAQQAGASSIELMWFGVHPFNYDFWIVRTDSDGAHIDQQDVKAEREGGYFVFRRALVGKSYSFVVEGCDERDSAGHYSVCRQGWLHGVAVLMKPHPRKAAPTLNDPPGRDTSCWTSLPCIGRTIKKGAAAVNGVAGAVRAVAS